MVGLLVCVKDAEWSVAMFANLYVLQFGAARLALLKLWGNHVKPLTAHVLLSVRSSG